MTIETRGRRVPERSPLAPGALPAADEVAEDVADQVALEALLRDVPALAGPGHEPRRGTFERARTPTDADTDRRRVRRSPRAALFVTVSHWGMATLLALNLLSGIRIGWGFVASPVARPDGAWGTLLAEISPRDTLLGVNLMTLHVGLAFLMLLVGGVYVGYLVRARTAGRLRVTREGLQKLWRGTRMGQFWRDRAALRSANILTYWLLFLFVAVQFITGLALYRLDWGLSEALGGYSVLRRLHALQAYLLLPLVLVHAVLQWRFGRFWAIFKAHLFGSHVRAGLVSLAMTVPVIAGLYLWNARPTTLTVKRITAEQRPTLDGDPSDPVWNETESVVVRTVKGVNNPQDYVDIVIKAVHDGGQIYFLFQWDDPDASFKRFPLLKTEHGWKVLQTAYERSDENVYYEDKLSVYLTDVPNRSCAATCHLGVGPYADKAEKHGLHYTSGEIGDVWHWKAVRSNPMGFMDDQHFRAPDPVPPTLGERYTGGYYPDPSPGGGYDYNFVKLDPKQTLAETYVRPKMLPARRVLVTNVDPTETDLDAVWWIDKTQGIPYSPEADTYPVGALIPNILVAPFQGDRADVRAKAQWRMGRWTLEARRVLDTKSKFDVAFSFERPVYLSVATYNRTQTRHGEHIRPVRVVLQP